MDLHLCSRCLVVIILTWIDDSAFANRQLICLWAGTANLTPSGISELFIHLGGGLLTLDLLVVAILPRQDGRLPEGGDLTQANMEAVSLQS